MKPSGIVSWAASELEHNVYNCVFTTDKRALSSCLTGKLYLYLLSSFFVSLKMGAKQLRAATVLQMLSKRTKFSKWLCGVCANCW